MNKLMMCDDHIKEFVQFFDQINLEDLKEKYVMVKQQECVKCLSIIKFKQSIDNKIDVGHQKKRIQAKQQNFCKVKEEIQKIYKNVEQQFIEIINKFSQLNDNLSDLDVSLDIQLKPKIRFMDTFKSVTNIIEKMEFNQEFQQKLSYSMKQNIIELNSNIGKLQDSLSNQFQEILSKQKEVEEQQKLQHLELQRLVDIEQKKMKQLMIDRKQFIDQFQNQYHLNSAKNFQSNSDDEIDHQRKKVKLNQNEYPDVLSDEYENKTQSDKDTYEVNDDSEDSDYDEEIKKKSQKKSKKITNNNNNTSQKQQSQNLINSINICKKGSNKDPNKVKFYLNGDDISDQHASIQYDQNKNEYYIIDLKSQSGTFYKEDQMMPLLRNLLKENDYIQFGKNPAFKFKITFQKVRDQQNNQIENLALMNINELHRRVKKQAEIVMFKNQKNERESLQTMLLLKFPNQYELDLNYLDQIPINEQYEFDIKVFQIVFQHTQEILKYNGEYFDSEIKKMHRELEKSANKILNFGQEENEFENNEIEIDAIDDTCFEFQSDDFEL